MWKTDMSLNEGSLQQDAGSPSNDASANIPRSKSFTGVTNHKRSASSASAEGCMQESEVGVRTTWGPTLGHCLQSPKLFRHPLSFGGQSKSPKSFRPARALIMFEQISKGLRECLAVTEEDTNNLKHTLKELSNQSQQSSGKLYEFGKQLKAAERYMKRLEYQLSKVEELHEQYNIQQKLREGMKNMAYAYVSSSGKERDAALNNIKASYRDCAEKMSRIEMQLERMMGTLHFQMKGIQGFARLCSGDVFEITIKHCNQKWKSRGRVLKNGQQSWDSPHATFKALLGEILFVKAIEVKGLGKSVLLGNKFCETRDLFSAHPQIMTVNLNPSGSLKLNVIITWNPLDGNIDEVMRNHSAPNQMLPTKQLGSILSKGVDKSESRGFGAGNLHKFLSQDSLSPHTSILKSSENSLRQSNHIHGSPEISFNQRREKSTVINHIQCANNAEVCSVNSGEIERRSSLERLIGDSYPLGINETIHNLSSCLEDIQGQYPELNALELRVADLKLILGKRKRKSSQSSEFSTSIESVLECFDFLNTETDDDEDIEWLQNKITDNPKNLDPAKTSDSGIGSLSQASFQQGMQQNISPQNKCTSSVVDVENHIDFALIVHLSYCQHLIESLGAFGPLKCKEIYALQKLRKQVPILERFISIFNMSKEERKDITGVDELKDNAVLQELWLHCSEYRHEFCIRSSYMLNKLQEVCQQYVNDFPKDMILSVSKLIISRIIDNKFSPDAIVTVFQFKMHFQKEDELNLEEYFINLIREVRLISMLQSNNVPAILEAIELLAKYPPSSSCLQSISQLLDDPNETVQNAIKRFFEQIQHLQICKKIVTVFIEALEANDPLTRQGACLALMNLKACEHIDELAYISQTDECISVRKSAKQALLSFGVEGIRAYEQSQLSSLGFHGLGVK